VAQQIRSVLSDLDVKAIKIGMLSSAAIIHAVARALEPWRHIPVVLDPVMVAASGDRLLASDAVDALRRRLIPLALLVTPNLPEAAVVAGMPIAADEATMAAQGRAILGFGAQAVLVKGGHGEGPESTDILVCAGTIRRFSVPRLATRNVHGTGCTLSSAIAAGLAKGLLLEDAVALAKTYITSAIAAAADLKIGHGHGPAHHFYDWW
jgi:hydroxymethylpyrimidine/phosphomethylpyrimidine kinase